MIGFGSPRRLPWSATVRTVVTAGGTAIALCALAFSSGGYGEGVWAWLGVPALWLVVVAAVRPGELRLSVSRLAALGALVALAAWTAASLAWSLTPPETAVELQRTLMYVGVFAILLVVARERFDGVAIVAGLGLALTTVVVVALGDYLVARGHPDQTQGRLLFEPVGYANAFGGLITILLVLLVAAAAYASPFPGLAAAAAAAAVPALTALYLTQSRSAWLALAVALAAFLALARPRPDVFVLLAVAAPAAAAAAVAASLGLATTRHESTREWRSLLLAAAVVFGAVVAFVIRRRSRERHSGGLRGARFVGLAIAVAAALAVTAGIVRGGFGDRAEYWRVAAHVFAAHPLGGAGAGSWGAEWLRLRTIAVAAKDAHSLYLETLAELGLVGFALLLAALAVPLVAARRHRTPFDAAVVASYSAYLVHAAFEWDWEMPVVTLSGLVLATALLVRSDESGGRRVRLAAPGRLALAAGALAAAAFLAVGGLGHAYVVRAEKFAADGRLPEADAKAQSAERLLPWASEPLVIRGDLRLHSGDRRDARAFYRRALDRDRSDWQIWLRLSLATQGQVAADARRRAFALDPGLERGTP